MLNVGVYLTSKADIDPSYHRAIEDLASIFGSNDMHMIYGGMVEGLMGRLLEFTLAARARVTGIIRKPKASLNIASPHHLLDRIDQEIVGSFSERKVRITLLSDMIVIFPGAYGTLDEALSTLYWGTRGYHNKPMIFLNINGFWNPLKRHFDQICETSSYLMNNVYFVDSVDDFLTIARNVKSGSTILSANPSQLCDFENEILHHREALVIRDSHKLGRLQVLGAALVLRQMAFIQRDIVIFNKNGEFDFLLQQLDKAHAEKMMPESLWNIPVVINNQTDLDQILMGNHPNAGSAIRGIRNASPPS